METLTMMVDNGTTTNFVGTLTYNDTEYVAQGKSVAYLRARMRKQLSKAHNLEVKLNILYKENSKINK